MIDQFNTISKIKNKIESSEFLYIVYSEYGCKIGISKSPLDRLETIRLGIPSQTCFYIGLYIGEQSAIFEKKLHAQYKKQKISGEWFYLNEDNLENIDTYLRKNNFHRMIKLSILWANYMLPSIFLEGKVQIIESPKRIREIPQKESLENHYILNFIQRVENDNNFDPEIKYMTSTQISEYLISLGFNYNPVVIGGILTNLNFLRKSKRINGQSKQVYILKLKKET